MTKVRVNMKNGDKFVLIFEAGNTYVPTETLIKKHIFVNFDKKNDLNIRSFTKEDKGIVAIVLEDISSVERESREAE